LSCFLSSSAANAVLANWEVSGFSTLFNFSVL